MESRVNPHVHYHITEQVTPMPDPGDSPIGISLEDVRRWGPGADLAHASRIRRTVAQRRRVHHRPPKEAVAISARPAVNFESALGFNFAPSPADEGLPNSHLIPHLYTATANSWHPPGSIEQEIESVQMDEHGRIIPDESYGIDEEIGLKVESPCGESSLALIEGHRRAGESLSPLTAKRPRGRPRKHPIPCESENKIAKGRSKTGCITCRKRKKKCDETKPRCMNCEKNAVVCEGYPERMVWKSGREKAEGMPTWTRQMPEVLHVSTGQSPWITLPNIQLQPVIHGVETAGDRLFFEHYVFRLSSVLTVEGPRKNAFKDMLLPMAVQHLGLMHSILSLSSSNMDYQSDYGKALLAKHTDVDQKMLEDRAQFHQDEAVKEFFLDIERQKSGGVENAVLPVIYGQMLCFVVKSLTEGQTTGAHRVHLQAYQQLIREKPPEASPFMDFVHEYFQFHIALDGLVSIPPDAPPDDDDASLSALLPPATPHAPGRLFGIHATLFALLPPITALRHRIRRNLARGAVPAVDYTVLHRAAAIDAAIRAWTPPAPPHDVPHVTALLYRQMLWVYLWRSIYPPSAGAAWAPDPRIAAAVDAALLLLRLVPPAHPAQTLLLAPTFIVGCAAFEVAQRKPVRDAVRVIKAYTALKNADRALEVLEAVWRYMDARDERSWDWQGIAGEMKMDFLAT